MATNRKLPKDLSERIKKDALVCNRTIQAITELALTRLYRLPLSERQAIIAGVCLAARSGRRPKL